ncbi:hypothetical protein DAPPUDRAFT_114826 [Daphnia pulex]|uniref:Uncharacterized protein n=1 Tax=Daphnia pulex TaxID=6669 RepID=E9HJC7_DAPPU|nr:hypothetical protein DAPPUDRAFT_114826 [Daphnia pulex]|eukprot:EFX68168.1 hypothetical protein DAPPUDRAFT_114826 [Daphnia pulex]
MEEDFDGVDTQANTAAEAQSESIIVIQASSQMNPNAVSFRPLKEKLAREKKGKPKVKLADESRIAIYAGLVAVDKITFHQSVGFFHLTQGAAFLPRASPALCRRIHFSEEEFANADEYDSGIGNQDQSLDVSLMLVSPATLSSIAVDATTIPAIAADAPTIPAIAADAPTLLTIEGKAPIIPMIKVDAPTIPAFAEDGTTIPEISPTIREEALTIPAIAKRGRPCTRLVHTQNTRRWNSCDDWGDIFSFKSDEALGHASRILHLLCRQTLLAYTFETGVGSLVKPFKNLSDIEKKILTLFWTKEKQLDREEYIPLLGKIVGKVDMEGMVDPKDQYRLATNLLGYIVVLNIEMLKTAGSK